MTAVLHPTDTYIEVRILDIPHEAAQVMHNRQTYRTKHIALTNYTTYNHP